jgi:hypothetical protein
MLTIRGISESVAIIVAELHAQSWQASYRGILRDDYLDGPIFEERFTVWRERLSNSDREYLRLLALSDASVVGFAFVTRLDQRSTRHAARGQPSFII